MDCSRTYNSGVAAFDAPVVNHPLGKDGGFGAVELAVRYSDMDLNYAKAGSGLRGSTGTSIPICGSPSKGRM